jgi:predicted RNA-binding Zn-ribbon protein involved in translation (DUF1610 family)
LPNELDRQAHAKQTHCYTCGKKFGHAKYECPICGEWQCSDECRQKHTKTMDNLYDPDGDTPSELQEEAELLQDWE